MNKLGVPVHCVNGNAGRSAPTPACDRTWVPACPCPECRIPMRRAAHPPCPRVDTSRRLEWAPSSRPGHPGLPLLGWRETKSARGGGPDRRGQLLRGDSRRRPAGLESGTPRQGRSRRPLPGLAAPWPLVAYAGLSLLHCAVFLVVASVATAVSVGGLASGSATPEDRAPPLRPYTGWLRHEMVLSRPAAGTGIWVYFSWSRTERSREGG